MCAGSSYAILFGDRASSGEQPFFIYGFFTRMSGHRRYDSVIHKIGGRTFVEVRKTHMYEVEHHEMSLVDRHASGAEEWCCPTCGRRFVMTWSPNYQKVVLEPGNEYAEHSGSKGELRLAASQVVETEDRILSDELRAALDELDLDALFED